jgi:hypothetical protein
MMMIDVLKLYRIFFTFYQQKIFAFEFEITILIAEIVNVSLLRLIGMGEVIEAKPPADQFFS